MWKVLGESVTGTSHQSGAGECQDAVAIHAAAGKGKDFLVFALSDGAGSAKHASEASQLIVERFCAEVMARLAAADMIADEDLLHCCETVQAAVLARAEELGVPPRELSATLLGGAVIGDKGWFIQIGDGAIVWEKEGCYRALTWPDAGEFVNTTVFLTSPDWREHVQTPVLDEPFTAIAAFTDGLQELILQHSDRSVHQAFFPAMMAQLRECANPGRLSVPLRNFLDSKPVNERTDDDKTLLLACRVD